MPFPLTFKVRHALKNPEIPAPFGEHQENRPRLALAAPEHRREAASGLDLANQCRYLEMRREPRAHGAAKAAA